MRNQQFYLSPGKKHDCVKIPNKSNLYLLISNYLNEYFSDEDKKEVLSNLGILSRLEELKLLIDNKVIESGSIPFDSIPTKDSTNILSSGTIYDILLNYYNKDNVNNRNQILLDYINLLNDLINIIKNLLVDDLYLSLNYQKILISGETVKTINGESILGSGNINTGGTPGQDGLTPYIKDNAWYIGDTKIQDIPSYQETLISGENIKSINGLSILGSGDITINSSNPITVDSETSTDSQNPVQNKVITSYITQEISRLEQLLSNYQETLVNLSNIKSINNKSLLGSGNILLFEVLTLEEYDSLDSISEDTLYLIVEEENNSWTFGDNFPIILS